MTKVARPETHIAPFVPSAILIALLAFASCLGNVGDPAPERRRLDESQASSSCRLLTDWGTQKRSKYQYGPSIMRDDDGRYRMWWCGQDKHDVIYYAESADSMSWSAQKIVLRSSGPHQGIHACDPSVVKASNGLYYMFFTSEASHAGVGQDNAIFLATSPDGVTWSHANGGRPVIPLGQSNNTYGVGQSSVILTSQGFLHFFTDTTSGGNNIFVARSSDGGLSFKRLNGGKPVLSGVTAVDVKYLESRDQYLVAAEGPHQQWKLSFYLLDHNFGVIKHSTPTAAEINAPCNHNPGLLGDARGTVIDEARVPVFFGSGTTTNVGSTACWNPNSWDIRRAELAMSVLRNKTCSSNKPAPPGPEDCSLCAPDGCDAACQAIGHADGVCAAPGSTDPAHCCACSSPPAPAPKPKPAPSHPGKDAFAPIGVLDGVSNGTAWGWACDKDDPTRAIDVHLFVGGTWDSGAPGYSIHADQASEAAVIGKCGGGTAHRFRFEIPNWNAAIGKPLYAYGINLTDGGTNVLLSNSPLSVK